MYTLMGMPDECAGQYVLRSDFAMAFSLLVPYFVPSSTHGEFTPKEYFSRMKTILVSFPKTILFVVLALASLCEVRAQVVAPSAEQRAARYLEAIRAQPLDVYAFLREMPKGGDLHMHLSGSVYAESFIEWAAEKPELCVDPATLAATACSGTTRPTFKQVLADGVLYRRVVDAWSMRNWQNSGLSGHDQFFDSFGKFGMATGGRLGEMVIELANRAAAERVSYLEIMLSADGGRFREAGRRLQWPSDEELFKMSPADLAALFAKKREELLAGGILQPLPGATGTAIQETRATIDALHRTVRDTLRCNDPAQAAPACRVTIRYITQVTRLIPNPEVFAQIVGAMELMKADPRVVGLNLVQPEDGRAAIRNFTLHMRMLDSMTGVKDYEKNRIALHAGELAPGLVAPEALRFHIRESVQLGRARRIGHGVDIMYEDRPYELLKEMAAKRILVEICLSSNDGILGVRGKEHPLANYLRFGVPVALATDDLGVARSEMTQEYLKAVREQGLGYLQLKAMARNSLEYSFVGGESFWKDAKQRIPVPACRVAASSTCRQYLEKNERARLQSDLEAAFARFEKDCCR